MDKLASRDLNHERIQIAGALPILLRGGSSISDHGKLTFANILVNNGIIVAIGQDLVAADAKVSVLDRERMPIAGCK
jgi:predicted amidohydrolase